MVDILDEAKQDLSRDRAQMLAKQHGSKAITAALLLIVGAIAWSWYSSYHEQKIVSSAEQYNKAMGMINSKPQKAANMLGEVYKNGSETFRAVAGLRVALMLEENNKPKALEIYDTIRDEEGFDQAYRDMASLRAARLLIVTGAEANDVQERLIHLMLPQSPWRFTAMEMKIALALQSGDQDLALALATEILNDENTPQTIRGRVSNLQQSMVN